MFKNLIIIIVFIFMCSQSNAGIVFTDKFNQKNILSSQKLIKNTFLKNQFMEKYFSPIYEFLIKLIRDFKNKEDWRDTSEIFYKQNSFPSRNHNHSCLNKKNLDLDCT